MFLTHRLVNRLRLRHWSLLSALGEVPTLNQASARINVRILGETSDQIGILLERHEIELAVGRFSGPLEHNKFNFTSLADEPLRAVARYGHPLARRRQLHLKDMVAWPWVLQTITSPARVLLEDEFAGARVSTPADMTECTSILPTLQLVQSSDAIAVLPESVVRDHVQARLLSSLALVVGRELKAFGVLTRKNEQLSEVAAAFVGHLHCNVAMPATAATKPAKAGALQRAGQKAPTPNAASAR